MQCSIQNKPLSISITLLSNLSKAERNWNNFSHDSPYTHGKKESFTLNWLQDWVRHRVYTLIWSHVCLQRGSASLSPQDRDAKELSVTHQIRWTPLASSQEHRVNQSALVKQKSPARKSSRNKQSSGESWAWRLSKNIFKWRKANREVWGRQGKEFMN